MRIGQHIGKVFDPRSPVLLSQSHSVSLHGNFSDRIYLRKFLLLPINLYQAIIDEKVFFFLRRQQNLHLTRQSSDWTNTPSSQMKEYILRVDIQDLMLHKRYKNTFKWLYLNSIILAHSRCNGERRKHQVHSMNKSLQEIVVFLILEVKPQSTGPQPHHTRRCCYGFRR